MNDLAPSVFGLRLLPSGAAWWPDKHTLILADLHLEKGSSRASHGLWLPPYDTRQTLKKVRQLTHEFHPRRILCLGDAFEDRQAWQRMEDSDRRELLALTEKHSWTWICGNHDPESPSELLGPFVGTVELDDITFSHQPGSAEGRRVFAHYHPKATVQLRGKRITGPCFVASPFTLLLPAFGAYTGGLDRQDPAIQSAVGQPQRTWLIHRTQVYPIS